MSTTPAAAAAAAARCSSSKCTSQIRGSLLYTPPVPASTSSINAPRSSRSCVAAALAAHQAHHHHAVVPAAAAADAVPNRKSLAASSSSSAVLEQSAATLDASSWLQQTEAALAAPAAATATATAAAGGGSSHGQRSKQSSRPAGVRSVGNEAAFFDSRPGPKVQRRARNRSPRPQRHVREAMQEKFSQILEDYQTGYEAWLHSQEDQLLRLQAQNAPRSELYYHAVQHDQLKRAWEQKWGPPAGQGNASRLNKLHLLPQAANGLRGVQQGYDNRQQQQQQQVQTVAEVTEQEQEQEQQQQQQHKQPEPSAVMQQQQRQQQRGAVVAAGAGSPRSNNSSSPRQQQNTKQQKGKAPRHSSAAARTHKSSSSSSRHGSKAKRVSSSALDIPDDTPECVSAAVAATEEAGQIGSYSNQAAGATVIVTAICQDPIDRETLDGLEVVFLHLTLQKLIKLRMTNKVPLLAEYILSRPDRNEHSFGAVFDAYAQADRLDLALSTWDRLAGQGVDIGPIGSSALIKACARQMDLNRAKQVFEQLLRRRVTFNSYTYHCLLQLCGSAGSLDDALAVYNLQRLETQRGNLPNSRTYLALTRAMLVAGRCELVQQIFENMLEDEVTPHPALYCNFLTAAGRAGNLGFARYLYQHMAVTLELPQPHAVHTCGLIPTAELQQQQQLVGAASSPSSSIIAPASTATTLWRRLRSSSSNRVADDAEDGFEEEEANAEPDLLSLVNALLNAHAQVGAMQGAVAIYRQELLGRGLRPDGYTCTALLTAAARLVSARLAWGQVAEVVELTHHYGITLSTQLGTALINAYRRVRCWEDQPQGSAAAAAAAAASKRGAGGKGRKRGGRPEADPSSSSTDAVQEDSTSQQQHQQQQQQQQEVGADAAREQEQLAAIGAQQLPGVSPVVCAALHAAQQVLLALQQHKLATSNSYVTMMCFLLEQGQIQAFKQLYEQATGQYHIGIDEQGWEKLAYAAAETGAGDLVASLQQQTQQQTVHKSQQQLQQEMLQQQRLRARQQQLSQQQQQQAERLAAPVAR